MVMTEEISLVQWAAALARKRGVQPLRLSISGKSKITLYAAPKPEERDDRVFPHMWVHHLRLRRTQGGLVVAKDTWDTLQEPGPLETTLHEWPAVHGWTDLKPPISFEKKQSLFPSSNYVLHYWTDETWSEEKFKWEFEYWKSIRDAEHHDMILLKRDPTWVVNPRGGRPMGFVYASHADPGKARIAVIWIEVNNAVALYYFAKDEFKEQVVEEYARPYKPEEQETRKEKLRHSRLGFNMTFAGVDIKEPFAPAYMHGPPLRQQELRLTLQNQIEDFRRSRVQTSGSGETETEVSVYIHPDVLEGCLGGNFEFEPGNIWPGDGV